MEDEISSECKVRVGLDLTGAQRRRLTGWERFALEYTAALKETAEPWCIPVPLEGSHRPGGRLRTLVQQLWRYAYQGRHQVEAVAVDITHALTFPPGNTGRPTVWTVHDDLVLGGHPEYARAGARIWVPLARRALRWTDRVVTDTHAVAEELAALGVPDEKLRIVTPGVPDLGQPVRPVSRPLRLTDGQPTDLPGEFLLKVGTVEDRKRPRLAAEVARRVGVPVVFIGRVDPGYRVPGWPPEALQLEGVTDNELSWLYRHTACLLALSSYEGFDFPMLEALSIGTPVVASDIAVHRELASSAAVIVAPDDPRAVADAVRTVTRGRPVSLSDWDACVRGYERVYAELA